MLNDPYLQPALREVSSSQPTGRRLTEKILVAFHQACDQADIEVASSLIAVVETIMRQDRSFFGPDRRRRLDNLVAAYERLWFIKHTGEDDMEVVALAAANG
ncbi:MAG: hypothetical protein JWP04_2081 [Belnapia sp.]|nr:hypothetical protein [Belnapia sp.]